MITYMDYTKADKHIFGENGFDPRFCGKCEAVMSQGNGYLGLRAAAEENYSQTTRDFLWPERLTVSIWRKFPNFQMRRTVRRWKLT